MIRYKVYTPGQNSFGWTSDFREALALRRQLKQTTGLNWRIKHAKL